MTSDEEFRDDLRDIVARHNPDADTLRDIADRIESLADYRDKQDELL